MPRKTKVSKNNNGGRIAFVISPIGKPDSPERKRADQILRHVIEPAISDFEYNVIRADKIGKPGTITTQVINHIINDPLVIADLTGHNPNVFYELAVRHAIKKPVIQIIRKGEKIPFDVSVQRTIQINHQDLDSVADAKEELKKQIQAVEKDPSLVDSPISTAVNLEFVKQSSDPELKAIADFRSTLQDINMRVKEIQEELEISKNREKMRYVYEPKPSKIRDFIIPRIKTEPMSREEQIERMEEIRNLLSGQKINTPRKKQRAKKD